MEQVRSFVVPVNGEVRCVEHLAQFVADQIDDRVEIQLGSETLLDRIDDGELGVALCEVSVGRRQFRRALFDFLLQTLRPLCIVERDGGLIGEQPHHVAVGVVEAAVAPIDVRVEIA